jgi:signal peptidase II
VNWLWISGLVVVLDQFTKYIADSKLDLHVPLEIFPNLNMTLHYNKGAAFSLLSNADGWQRWLLMVISLVACIALFYWLRKVDKNRKLLTLGIVFILGGAVGNLIDRSLYGHVIDFIDVYYKYWHWPAFNIADSAISVGASLLLIDIFVYAKPE